jgi:hypothetical protein
MHPHLDASFFKTAVGDEMLMPLPFRAAMPHKIVKKVINQILTEAGEKPVKEDREFIKSERGSKAHRLQGC